MKLAIFDCDGTLVDGQAPICDAMEETFNAFSITPPSRGNIRRAVGLSLPKAIQDLHPEVDLDLRDAMVERYKEAFRNARTDGRVAQPIFDGMPELLRELFNSGWTLGIATGMSDRGLRLCLAANQIADLFTTLQTADRHPSKPHPAMIEQALLDTGASADQSVMIGDTAYDMKMAAAANVHAIGVEWGYHLPEELLATGANTLVKTPQELLEHLLHA